VPKVFNKDKGILQIKMHDIQKPLIASLSSSESPKNESAKIRNCDSNQIPKQPKKQAAKTMRNFPLSASENQA